MVIYTGWYRKNLTNNQWHQIAYGISENEVVTVCGQILQKDDIIRKQRPTYIKQCKRCEDVRNGEVK